MLKRMKIFMIYDTRIYKYRERGGGGEEEKYEVN